MNLSELKENARSGLVNPRVIEIYLNRLVGCRIIDLVSEPTAVSKLAEACAKEGTFHILPIEEREEKLRKISETATLNDIIELVARHCGGNILRPYLKYLNIGEEKFRDYSFPQDVQHCDNPQKEGFEFWKRDLPYIEPDYFTEYEEEQIVYCETYSQPDENGCGLTQTYIEAPAVPLPCDETPPQEPFLEALDYSRTFNTMNDVLPWLVFVTILGGLK